MEDTSCSELSGVAPTPRMPVRLTIVAPQLIDRSVIERLSSFSSNPEFAVTLLGVAAEDIARIEADLAQALAARKFDRVGDLAHALKGVAASVGATRLAAAADTLCATARERNAAPMRRLAQRMADDARASTAALRDIAAQLERALSSENR